MKPSIDLYELRIKDLQFCLLGLFAANFTGFQFSLKTGQTKTNDFNLFEILARKVALFDYSVQDQDDLSKEEYKD